MQHVALQAGKWEELSFLEQVANIGSEVERTLTWKEKGNQDYSNKAFERSLELFNLAVQSRVLTSPQRKEINRAKELWIDFFKFKNIYKSSAEFWRHYFMQLLLTFRMKN